jgi:hypothetical protein
LCLLSSCAFNAQRMQALPQTTTPAILLAAALFAACAGRASEADLGRCVALYHDNIRWKRFTQAASFLPPEARQAFVERYLASEDRLEVESLEVRSVTPISGQERPTYDVAVVASAYLLPSTVLSRSILTERWQLIGGAWRVIHRDRELAPAAAAPPPNP